MSTDIDSIKRKLLIKYPVFGSVIANLEIQANKDIATAGTDGKVLLYNPKFLDGLSEKQQIFIFAHEICHVAFEHIFRSEGKDKRLWNIATDSVINALLKQDGLPIVEGGVDIPEAINYDAEEMYNQLLEEEKKKQEQQNSQRSQEENDIGHDTHSLWDKVTEERKKEQKETEEKSKFAEQGEIETFKQNKIERIKQLQKLSRELANEASHEAGTGIQRQGKKLSDIGIATPLIDWRKLLRQAVKYDEEWTRKNARMRNGYFRHKVEEIPIPETEILLDTSGSVSENLLKNFLKECKMIIQANSKVKVGCFNTEFYGFTEIKRIEDIDNMHFPIGGGTNYNVEEESFSANVPNKVIFTDGKAKMPEKIVRNVIWVVFGNEQINSKYGTVINIKDDQLKELYRSRQENKSNDINR